MSEKLFSLENVSFGYGGNGLAVKDVSFTVARGESVALLGANGSGKSTILKILDALIFPSSGKFSAFGREIDEKAAKDPGFRLVFRKEVALLFQNSDIQLFCEKVEDELAFTSLQLGMPGEEIKARIKEISGIFRLEGMLGKAPYNLSDGEKKRVSLASVLVHGPSILLLDEPTSHLDPRSVRFVSSFLKKLQEAGMTIVFATHEIALAKTLAQRVILLGENHSVSAQGDTDIILEDRGLLEKENLI